MIILQLMSVLILVLIIVLAYYSILKMLKEHEEIGNENIKGNEKYEVWIYFLIFL
jgi:heme/copper-type cytochrome/quinol oxidase subunit 2